MDDWKNHFASVLEGRDEDGREGTEKRKLEGDQEDELDEEEIEMQIRRVKSKKQRKRMK